MRRVQKVAIIGAGMGGLALANALKARNIDVKIHEQAEELTQVGAGIQLTPNAVKVLRGLGLDHRLKEFGFVPQAIMGLDGRSGKTVFRTPLAGACEELYDAPYVHIHRGDLQTILRDPLLDSMISLGKHCVDVRNESDCAVAAFSDGSSIEADLIVGADGIRSAARKSLFGADAPRFTNNICWRSVVPFENGPDYDLVGPYNSIWFGPNGHVVTYYVRGGKAVNIIACLESTDWQEESWHVRSTKEELANAYDGWHPKLQKIFARADEVYKWGLFDRDPMESWTRDRVTLLGDAAHPMLPYLSQGAAMAMEDALVLARMVGQQQDDLDAALRAYETIRIPRATRVQLSSREQGKKNHLTSPVARFVRDVEYRIRNLINPQASGLKAGWVYEYDAGSVGEPVPAL
ncbi:FAD-dependent monooxygenase [Roseiarcaceae bacterium H3SJ34-1]|uniref:FAD-dependent monooxygenase n=1 Tax=Terripilifer ovatus TaxID=3032367 RepID=UPI003AB926C6|nr:FAD-dependent monooxygenase [Roseiarcaceae bacterium H3SJ34-1]